MTIRFCRFLIPSDFAAKHPKPHVIVGRYNPFEQIDEEATGQPGYFSVLRTVKNTLSLAGDCTGDIDEITATIKLSYALAEDAARVCDLLKALPDSASGDCASLAFFNYDRALYDRLRPLRDERMSTIKEAISRGEDVQYSSPEEPVNDNGGRRASPVDDDYGRAGASPR